MDVTLIKKLITLVEKSSITELLVEEGDLKLKISKNIHSAVIPATLQQAVLPAEIVPQSHQEPGKAEETEKPEEKKIADVHEIRSPIVGTFYRSPAPDADPYIQMGDMVSQGTVLCIVEAMKLMNEIECDVSGKVVKILVESGTPVEYNQPLFLVETD
ncbi:acetyl-CoA carboxylase biotin carboxyl carrier protein [Bacteroidota bacterium]